MKSSAAKPPAIQFLHFEADPANLVIGIKGVAAWQIRAGTDGRTNGVLDAPGLDAVRCWRPGPRAFLLKLFKDGAAVGVWTAEVSKNGKSLKVVFTAFDAAGKELERTDFFDKQ